GRGHWVAEEMAILTDPATYEADPEDAWRRVKSRSTSPRHLAVVRSLARWREKEAQARDVPRARIIKDDALLEVANACPRTPEELGKLRLVQREARKAETTSDILAAVADGLNCPPAQRPTVPPPPRRREGSAAIADMLKVFLKARADEIGVAAKLIASSADVEALAGEDDPDLPMLKGWRAEIYGNDAIRIKNGEVALVARPGGVGLVELDASGTVAAARSDAVAGL
ncbi:MAG: HRDC domain-containing protein, partial [Pseudomonadota bacterium]